MLQFYKITMEFFFYKCCNFIKLAWKNVINVGAGVIDEDYRGNNI